MAFVCGVAEVIQIGRRRDGFVAILLILILYGAGRPCHWILIALSLFAQFASSIIFTKNIVFGSGVRICWLYTCSSMIENDVFLRRMAA